MKVLYLTPFIFNSGGTERVLSMKVNYLVREAGYDVVIVTTDQKERQNYFTFDKKAKTYDLNINYEDDLKSSLIIRIVQHYKKNQLYRRKLHTVIESEKPDVCISLFGKEIEFLTDMNLKCKVVAELHFSQKFREYYLISRHSSFLWRLIGKFRTKQLIHTVSKFDKLVVLTKEDEIEWSKYVSNVVQCYNPLPYSPAERSPLNSKNIITVGRLDYQKNYKSLINAWKEVHERHSDWTLSLWGDGDLKDELVSLVKEKGLYDSFLFCGLTRKIEDEYMKSAAYVMSSRYEGFPMVLLEASSYGLPLISYACPCGPKDIIENGVNGYLIDQENEHELANAICKIIEDDALRQSMGRNSKEISMQFSQNRILKFWPEFFERLVNL